ncbi:E3 ubiquitin-protein ligase ORTHRUS 2-like [Cucurbita maxima]|uniref:RING-type E3 ubiquitin transferase n=1 Tax=Cucurbita maxima TaxID=3661 RepID=A0A6J1HS20_CUCMA|nr:E3 ubiquitin-protein ligase ORTHRUS 2-like [Cucurbita maxima]
MAQVSQLPCDGDGICMRCQAKPSDLETITCKTCVAPWHVGCLSNPPQILASTLQWDCPDCSPPPEDASLPPPASCPLPVTPSNDLVTAIRAIEADASLTDREKANKRQELLSGKSQSEKDDHDANEKRGDDVLDLFDERLKCSFCMQLPERPVTTPCGHNFCLKCFQKWIGQGKNTCAKCRCVIPSKMASHPRINSTLVVAIRMAKMSKSIISGGSQKVYHVVHNLNRPDKAYTTDRAQKKGKANAASGKIFVTIPSDHFGPILAENDPERNQGVLVGECWEDRLECRQWGAHFPHVAGIAGQSNNGAQSVVLSGGYQDDEDHGEWFLYTGSGGRDLSGNKRTSKDQSFDQKFEKSNKALQVSCLNGYPVRVVRSHKEKRSSYAPEKGLRYDGIYRIEKCWRKVGIQGFKVCRYLFVRCDNDPAPWTSDEHGDRPRPLPAIPELKKATDITERKKDPSWDFDEKDSRWKWSKPPPTSKKSVETEDSTSGKKSRRRMRQSHNMNVRERLLKEFSCLICREVMNLPITTPCAHNFCKSCLEGAFAGKSFLRERNSGGRALRSRKNVMACPCCPTDISDFLQNLQVNRELLDVIESLKSKIEEADASEKPCEDEIEGEGEGEGEQEEEGKDGSNGNESSRPVETRKRAKVVVNGGEENDSPSSPVHVDDLE